MSLNWQLYSKFYQIQGETCQYSVGATSPGSNSHRPRSLLWVIFRSSCISIIGRRAKRSKFWRCALITCSGFSLQSPGGETIHHSNSPIQISHADALKGFSESDPCLYAFSTKEMNTANVSRWFWCNTLLPITMHQHSSQSCWNVFRST